MSFPGGVMMQAQGEAFDPSFFFMMGAIFLIFYFLVIRPQQRQQKEREESIRALVRGAWGFSSCMKGDGFGSRRHAPTGLSFNEWNFTGPPTSSAYQTLQFTGSDTSLPAQRTL